MRLTKIQKQCVDEIEHNFKTHRAVCLSWYTGSGKTNIFIDFCKRRIADNPNVKIGISAYVTREVRDQVFDRFADFDIQDKCHVIEYQKPREHSKNVMIFNPQTVFRKPPDVCFDYFIIDESHVGLETDCKMLRRIMATMCDKNTKILIVSATPWDVLHIKEFKNIPVLKRPLDKGIADGRVTDFKFYAEEASISFTEEDFSPKGDLKDNSAMKQMSILKSVCLGKMKRLVTAYDKKLGKKVLVICPPGNVSEVARTLQKEFGGLVYIQARDRMAAGDFENTADNLRKFREGPERFLFVTNKCQVGFDMKELSSVVDLTMSRNIKVLAQRCGRIARANGTLQKNYFYIYDKSLMKNQLEWLLVTMVDFCLGHYDGWTTRTAYQRKTFVSQWSFTHPFTVSLTEIVKALRGKDIIKNRETLYFVSDTAPRKWTLDRAIKESEKWSSRTELWKNQPALYKWFRLNAKDELDRLFPLKHHIGKWNEQAVIELMKKCKSRSEFREHGGAYDWVIVNKRQDLRDKYLPESKSEPIWNKNTIIEFLDKIDRWPRVRNHGGARRWIAQNGGERYWKKVWEGRKN